MNIKRSRLVEIVHEEVSARLESLAEAERDRKRKPDVASADDEPTEPNDAVPDGGIPKGPDAGPVPPGKGKARGPDVKKLDGEEPSPDGPEADADPEQDADDALDVDGDAGEEPSGAVNDFASGKTVQALTIEPKSKVLPGAKEIVLAFNETTDPIRILVTPTGQVKFFSQGQLHDLP